MMAVGSSVAEDMVNWLESDENLKENPDAVRLKQCLLDMVAYKKRRLSLCGTDKSSNGMSIRRQNDVAGTGRQVVNAARYKTELCRSYSENGYCRYGDKCQFAHGAAELRTTVRHPRYKTELCKAYHTTGFCAYGARCNFIHNDSDLMEPSIVQPQAPAVQQSMLLAVPVSTPFPDPAWQFRLLGSTADSPPQSVTDSPSPSPTAMLFDSTFDMFPCLISSFPFQAPIGKL